MQDNRARDNRLYLLKTVFPFLQRMPTVEAQHAGKTPDGAAVCNLNHYIDDHDARTAPEEIDTEYQCGRTGCLAGWYVMLSDRDKRFGPFERNEVAGYDNGELAEHFGLGSTSEGEALFGGMGSGAEQDHTTTRQALRARKRRLREYMEGLDDFVDLKKVKVALRVRKVFGY